MATKNDDDTRLDELRAKARTPEGREEVERLIQDAGLTDEEEMVIRLRLGLPSCDTCPLRLGRDN